MTKLPPPTIDHVALPGGRTLRVVRDDLINGGTKRRVLPLLLRDCDEAVYASPPEGFAQVALGMAALDVGCSARVFVAARKEAHPNTVAAMAAGAKIQGVRPGYMTVVTARARAYCEDTGARLLPFGLDTPDVIQALADVARGLNQAPREVWCVAGSGVVARALEQAWPDADLRVVAIGRTLMPGDVPDSATVYVAPESFSRDAVFPPPFPSCRNYDAKAWRFMQSEASDGALFWNVA